MSLPPVYSIQVLSATLTVGGGTETYTVAAGKRVILTDLTGCIDANGQSGGTVEVFINASSTGVILERWPAGWKGTFNWEGRIVLIDGDTISVTSYTPTNDLSGGYVLSGYELQSP
jgi:hypothetical protein